VGAGYASHPMPWQAGEPGIQHHRTKGNTSAGAQPISGYFAWRSGTLSTIFEKQVIVMVILVPHAPSTEDLRDVAGPPDQPHLGGTRGDLLSSRRPLPLLGRNSSRDRHRTSPPRNPRARAGSRGSASKSMPGPRTQKLTRPSRKQRTTTSPARVRLIWRPRGITKSSVERACGDQGLHDDHPLLKYRREQSRPPSGSTER